MKLDKIILRTLCTGKMEFLVAKSKTCYGPHLEEEGLFLDSAVLLIGVGHSQKY